MYLPKRLPSSVFSCAKISMDNIWLFSFLPLGFLRYHYTIRIISCKFNPWFNPSFRIQYTITWYDRQQLFHFQALNRYRSAVLCLPDDLLISFNRKTKLGFLLNGSAYNCYFCFTVVSFNYDSISRLDIIKVTDIVIGPAACKESYTYEIALISKCRLFRKTIEPVIIRFWPCNEDLIIVEVISSFCMIPAAIVIEYRCIIRCKPYLSRVIDRKWQPVCTGTEWKFRNSDKYVLTIRNGLCRYSPGYKLSVASGIC